jgi:RNA polymerase sigma factor (sigma-70 family)
MPERTCNDAVAIGNRHVPGVIHQQTPSPCQRPEWRPRPITQGMDPHLLDQLAVGARAGDRQAFHELMRATLPEVRLFIAARAYSLELVEEVLQATYVACFESLPKYEPRRTLLPWLKGIAHNRLRRELESRSRHAHVDVLDQILVGEAACQIDEAPPADEAVLARMRRCLERLAPHARILLESRHVRGESVDGLAARFEKSRDAIASTLKRVRASMRDCMRTLGPDGAEAKIES